MSSQAEKAARFLARHRGEKPLLIPNPWDAGSARLLAAMGFEALATTSGGFAGTLGRPDGSVTRDEAIGHSAVIVAATDLPVSADLENGFTHDPEGVAETVQLAIGAGLAGCSIEDYSADPDVLLYPFEQARDRVAAAADAAHAGDVHLVLTARAENYLRGRPDLADTIARLQAYQEAGADVLYAPGLSSLDDIRSVVSNVDRPVNILAFQGVPPVAQLSEVGVGRISVGSAFFRVACAAVVDAGRELQGPGTYGYLETMASASDVLTQAFS